LITILADHCSLEYRLPATGSSSAIAWILLVKASDMAASGGLVQSPGDGRQTVAGCSPDETSRPALVFNR